MDATYQPSAEEQLLEASRSAAERGLRVHNEVEIREMAERIEQRESAGDLLDKWLSQPGTQRSVTRLAYTAGHFEIELSAGGFRYTSVTQTSLEGAIRNVLGAAQFDE